MFKSIDFFQYDKKIKSFIYKLIDTEFECNLEIAMLETDVPRAAIVAAISEYKKRNYSHDEIVRNLFKCNIYICNKFNHSFEKELSCQLNHIDTYYKDISFAKLYYDDIKAMWDKRKVFI